MRSLKKPATLAMIGLVAIGALAGCDASDADSPSNPANFPSRTTMNNVAKKWYPIVLSNGIKKGQAPTNAENGGCNHGYNDVRWSGDRWSMDTGCRYFDRTTGISYGDSVTAHADYVKDWITGSKFQ